MNTNIFEKRICVIGLGYIGLPTAGILASSGYQVLGVDVNKNIVDLINKGEIHIYEPGLKELIYEAVKQNKLSASVNPNYSDVFIIAVPTPLSKNNSNSYEPDISYVLKAVNAIAPFYKKGNLLILESTSPIGTTNLIEEILSELCSIKIENLMISYCPERVLPGNILHELKNNNRVIGGINDQSTNLAKEFYKTFCSGKLLTTSSKTAEMVKLTENSFRDVNIAFANELSIICEEEKIDVKELIKLSNYHPRVNILNPGCGVGGHCIAIDPWFIASKYPKQSKLIRTAREVNDKKSLWVLQKIIDTATSISKSQNRKILIGCYGITFKPDIDDTRESPALFIVKKLDSLGYNIAIAEPNLQRYENLNLKSTKYVFKNSDLNVLLVAHAQFKEFDFRNKKVLDICGLLE